MVYVFCWFDLSFHELGLIALLQFCVFAAVFLLVLFALLFVLLCALCCMSLYSFLKVSFCCCVCIVFVV